MFPLEINPEAFVNGFDFEAIRFFDFAGESASSIRHKSAIVVKRNHRNNLSAYLSLTMQDCSRRDFGIQYDSKGKFVKIEKALHNTNADQSFTCKTPYDFNPTQTHLPGNDTLEIKFVV